MIQLKLPFRRRLELVKQTRKEVEEDNLSFFDSLADELGDGEKVAHPPGTGLDGRSKPPGSSE